MKEIKFRGKRIDNDEWVYGYLVKSEDYIFDYSERIDIPYIIPFNNFNLKDYGEYRVEEKTIGQFTGLYDKNDVEIYEGDLLKVYFDINEIDDYLFFSLNDEERESGWFIKEVTIPEFYAEPINDDFEVIGNIYDNKEDI